MISLHRKEWIQLMARLFRIYVLVAAFGIAIISFHNLYINELPLSEFFRLRFFAKLLLGCLLIVSFQIVSYWRLRDVRDYFESMNPVMRQAAWQSLLRFPTELFWGMIIYGMIVSPMYHVISLSLKGGTLLKITQSQKLYLIENVLFDQALSLTLATLFYAVLRRVSRSYLSRIKHYELTEMNTLSFIRPLLMTFVSLFLISGFSTLWYVTNAVSSERTVHLPFLFAISAFTFILSLVLFIMQVVEHRNNFQDMISNIRLLLAEEGHHLRGNMPIVSRDEAGTLASVFNQLQNRISKEYDEMERELQLAHNVQQKLLPNPYEEIGSLRIAGAYRPTKEVGGDFYDVIDLRDGRTAVVIGDVSGKGIQAALIMSAVVVLMRSEVRRGGTPAEVLERLNIGLVETLRDHSFVTVGLGVFDMEHLYFEYAGAGHLPPYLLRDGNIVPFESSSLPLGVELGAAYQGVTEKIHPGDRIVFCTDGIVEAMDVDGSILGFDQFENVLRELDIIVHPSEAVGWLMDKLPKGERAPYSDDRTLVLAEVVRSL